MTELTPRRSGAIMDIDDTPTTSAHGWFDSTGCQTPTDQRNQRHFLAWASAWAVAFVAATWFSRTPGLVGLTPWLVAALPAALSVPVFMAYLRFLGQADELVRRVQLEGLAVGFGAGVLLAIGYPLFASAGAPPLDFSAAAGVMILTWVVGQIAASARYR